MILGILRKPLNFISDNHSFLFSDQQIELLDLVCAKLHEELGIFKLLIVDRKQILNFIDWPVTTSKSFLMIYPWSLAKAAIFKYFKILCLYIPWLHV